MHAYAGDDPVFLAMNARAQRETNGALGTFCVSCHAPMAVRLGLTKDGTNLAALPANVRGVTCYACHAIDGEMHGAIVDPLPTDAHASAYAATHDRSRAESAQLCGGCHDVTTPANVAVERTYSEWRASTFASDATFKACGACHMPATDGAAATIPNAPTRRVHDHAMPGVDVALGPWPEADAQRKAVQSNLDPAITAKLCVTGESGKLRVSLTLGNANIGHDWPSGASHDRRAWAEIAAYDGARTVFTSDAFVLRERLFDARGGDVRFMWQAVSFAVASLPPQGALAESWLVDAADRVTARVRITPFGADVVDDLIASGDLDPKLRDAIPTFTLRITELEWTAARGVPSCIP